ncbi:MAG: tRNA (guanosine(46)-N7)-methyltransferase TrmB [Myxococcales bacterium]|nr:tRNA (guanosine(46)-N7)-methyltransferase TrmB [Myxococcales bacterium]MCB9644125.1 tRNA (guanosine(46)-N7)-methyltransferase TrmB [Myxococcales bacterium]
MRTGKNRTFTIDHEKTNNSLEDLKKGKGLYGGDITRMPTRRGIAPYVDFSPVPEVRRLHEDPTEEAEKTVFLSKLPVEVEIGFGRGGFLRHRAARFPDKHFLGFEIHKHLCVDMVTKIHQMGLENLRICFEDCRSSLPALLPQGSIDRAFVFFPDPWWKRKHVPRRLLSPAFLDILYPLLTEDGVLSIKTDVLPYADVVEAMFAEDPRFELRPELEAQIFDDFSPTEREAFCSREGLPFRTFCYAKKPQP